MVSVIMSTYNETEQNLRGAIQSILAQTFRDFEFIIVIDNPENQILKSCIEEYALADARIRILVNPQNQGLVCSLNRALSAATGEYIARMDADDFALPDRLKLELEYIRENDLDIVGARTQYMDMEGNLLNRFSAYYPPELVSKALSVQSFLPHPTWMVRKKVYDALEGYRMVDSCEDYDFLLRAREKGYKIGMHDQVLLQYRINTNGISQKNAFRQFLCTYYVNRNRNHICEVSPEEISRFVSENLTETENEKFLSTSRKINEALKKKRQAPFAAIWEIVCALTVSKFQRAKLHLLIKSKLLNWKIKKSV